MQDKSTQMYSVESVAQRWAVSKNTVYRAIKAGQLEALRLGTGKGVIRIPEAAVHTYEQACAQAAYDTYVIGDASPAADDGQVSAEVV